MWMRTKHTGARGERILHMWRRGLYTNWYVLYIAVGGFFAIDATRSFYRRPPCVDTGILGRRPE